MRLRVLGHDRDREEPRNVNRHFDRLCEKAGVRRVRFHDLRQSCASLLYSQGVPLEVIQDVLGHSSPTVTKVIYVDVAEDVTRTPSTDSASSSGSTTKRDVGVRVGVRKGGRVVGPPCRHVPGNTKAQVRECLPGLSRSALGGIRTPNLLIRSQMLYPLSYERWTTTSNDTWRGPV